MRTVRAARGVAPKRYREEPEPHGPHDSPKVEDFQGRKKDGARRGPWEEKNGTNRRTQSVGIERMSRVRQAPLRFREQEGEVGPVSVH
jgi:hypothetical protein